MHERKFKTGLWSNTALSPIDFNSRELHDLEVVIAHSGWQKPAWIQEVLMDKLVDTERICPITIDTRLGKPKTLLGSDNTYFGDATAYENRFLLRRPTGLLQIIDELKIDNFHFVGHSRGAEIGLIATGAEKQPATVASMTLVNGVGTGALANIPGLVRANATAWKRRDQLEIDLVRAAKAALESTLHFLAHIPRSTLETREMFKFEAWPHIDRLIDKGVPVTVMNAVDDALIDYKDARSEALEREESKYFTFETTEGGHSNIYELPVINKIVETVLESIDQQSQSD